MPFSGGVLEPLQRGFLTRDRLVAGQFDLCTERHPGRTAAERITMYKNSGGGHLDLFTARYLLRRLGN